MTARVGPGGIALAARRTVQAHFFEKMDENTQAALASAMWNLYCGPDDGGLSYTECLRILRTWADDELMDVYYDIQCGEVLESEPQSWKDEDGNVVEPSMDDYMCFDVSDVKRLMFANLITHGGF